MLSKTIRNADLDKISEFDLETWAHRVAHLEDTIAEWAYHAKKREAENAELREIVLARGEKLGYADEDLRD